MQTLASTISIPGGIFARIRGWNTITRQDTIRPLNICVRALAARKAQDHGPYGPRNIGQPWSALRPFCSNQTTASLSIETVTLIGCVKEIKVQRGKDWCVVKVSEVSGKLTEVVGNMPGIQKGKYYKISGYFNEHAIFGSQLRVDSIASHKVLPEEFLKEYLQTIPNVGEELAQRIASKFGHKTRNVILGVEGKLHDIKGISEKSAKEIVKYCQGDQNLLKVHEHLAPLGIS
jgi:hypothetical protein